MPRDRFERSVVLNEVRELDRQQRLREGGPKQINRNPELKRACDLLLNDLPNDDGAEFRHEVWPASPFLWK